MAIKRISAADRQNLEYWANFLSIKNTRLFLEFLKRWEKIIFFITGNQWGKNVNIMKQYIIRWRGEHPIPWKNLPFEGGVTRTYRFCSEKKPLDPDGGESNTIYPVLKRMIPKWMIVKDISQRRDTMQLRHPKGGEDFYAEFVSYSQDTQVTAGQQRLSVYLDERSNREFFEEQIPRILSCDGDIIGGLTPALGAVTFQFEDILQKANTIIRTRRVREKLKEVFNEDHPYIETFENNNPVSICVLQAATDDNPLYADLVKARNERDVKLIEMGKHPRYKKIEDFKSATIESYIKENLGFYDLDTELVRRYGIFREMSGRIMKEFETAIHRIYGHKYFPEGIPHFWLHGRAIDYHQSTPWHTTFIAISPEDEAFVYDELVMSPDRYVTFQIGLEIAKKSKDYKYLYNKIDPLAAQVQTNTGVSTIQDLNRLFHEFKRDGICEGGYWTSWDSKSTRGREEVKKRLHNSRLCGIPFNNKIKTEGGFVNLPTIWILDNCVTTIDCFKNWRYEEWSDRSKLETKEAKETPMQRYSHIMTAIEAMFKESGFHARSNVTIEPRRTAAQYGRR